jgi:hypothetical protein
LAEFGDETLLASQRKAARGALGAAHQHFQIGEVFQRTDGVIERIRVGAPFLFQQDRRAADNQQDGETRDEDKTPRQDRLPAGSRVGLPFGSIRSFLFSSLFSFLGDGRRPWACSGSH